MQSKTIFKDHIDRLSTDVWLNSNYHMVCGVIFSPRFYISDFLIQYNTSKKNCEMIISHMTRFQINFVLLAKARNIFGIRVASLKMFTYNLQLRKFHSQGNVAKKLVILGLFPDSNIVAISFFKDNITDVMSVVFSFMMFLAFYSEAIPGKLWHRLTYEPQVRLPPNWRTASTDHSQICRLHSPRRL